MTDKDDKTKPSEYAGLLLGDCDEHKGQHVLYERDGNMNLGVLRPFEEGKSMDPNGEIVEIHRNGPLAVLRNHGRIGDSSGPAKVNSNAYKSGWDQIFATKKRTRKMVN